MTRFHSRSVSSRALQTLKYCSIGAATFTILLSVGAPFASPSQTPSAGDVLGAEKLAVRGLPSEMA
jgi:hypothetical protein